MHWFYAIRTTTILILCTQTALSMDEKFPITKTCGIGNVYDTEQGIVRIKNALSSPYGSTEYTSNYGSVASISNQSDTAGILYVAAENVETLKHLFAVSAATSARFGQKELMLYLEIIKLYKSVGKEEEDFLNTLDEAQQSMIRSAYRQYSNLKEKLNNSILEGNVQKFQHALLAIIASTYRTQNFEALNDDELKTAITLLASENNRIIEISENLNTFTFSPWLAKNPKKSLALIIGGAIGFEGFINALCYGILHKLSATDVISAKTIIGVLVLTNLLVFAIVVSFVCFFPIKFICCNKNNAKLATVAIQEMKDLVDDKSLTHINLLAHAQKILHLRQLGQRQVGRDQTQEHENFLSDLLSSSTLDTQTE